MERFRLSGEALASLVEALGASRPEVRRRLARARWYVGPLPDAVLRLAGAAGLTVGRHVLLHSAAVGEWEGRAQAPATLVVHEAVHVLQYADEGVLLFLARYLAAYARGIARYGGRSALRRSRAYRAIPHEAEAFAAGHRFLRANGPAALRLVAMGPAPP